jgi:SHS2 domain-containing protein
MNQFEILEHTADIGFRAWGATSAEMFENAARALMYIATEPSIIDAVEERTVEVSGADYESLIVNWLSEIVYLFDAGVFAPRDFHVHHVSPQRLHATCAGEKRDPQRHPWKLIVKAITYHQLEIIEKPGHWETAVFVDI